MTFLFTDIEGSTQMAQRLGSQFREVVEDHNAILSGAINAHHGVTLSTSGDSVFAVFTNADDAVVAALEAQRRLRRHSWPDGGRVLVRMGAHTGEGRLGAENYVGVDVITAARISAAAHGGQVIVSEATRSRIGERDLDAFEVRDLGSHRLKGIEGSQRLFQILSSDLPADFPPPATQGAPTNLPAQDSLFVGRTVEAAELRDILLQERLVTLYGPGGTGKTRLAQHVAGELVGHFEGGVHQVRLNAARDPDRVAPSIVEVIGASQIGGAAEAIAERVASKSWLLLLDGFEHLTEAGPLLTSLLEECERLTFLVTSQRLMHTRFERVYPLPPLGLPEDSTLEGVQASDGASLFVKRVASLDPSFALTEENASIVADIVNFVDGLPLAIELAAARVRLMGLARLREDVNESISVLSGGFAGDADRHRSMEAAVAWSYGTLDEEAQALFRRCSRFVGGFTFDALNAVCAGDPVLSIHDSMMQLLDSSLVNSSVSAGNVRFRMLEPLRKFGLQRMDELGESDVISRRHAEHYTAVVKEAAGSMHGPDHYAALERLALERPNLSAALEWSIANEPDLGLTVLVDLAHSFPVIGALADGSQLAERLLGAGGSPRARLSGLLGAGAIAYWRNDYNAAEAHYREAIQLASELDLEPLRADALYGQAFSLVWLGRPDAAEAVANLIELPAGDPGTRMSRGILAMRAFVDWMRGDLESAARKLDEVIAASHRSGFEVEELFYGLALSGISVLRGEVMRAVPFQVEALLRFSELQDEGGMMHALDWLAEAVIAIDTREGLVMASAVDSLRRRRGGFIDLTRLGMPDPREQASEHMSRDQIESQWMRGRELELDGAMDLALEWAERFVAGEEPV